jgi:hypothetical protein
MIEAIWHLGGVLAYPGGGRPGSQLRLIQSTLSMIYWQKMEVLYLAILLFCASASTIQ